MRFRLLLSREESDMARRQSPTEYPDDIFDHTRMSFGDHIEILRKHLIRAVVGLLVCLIGGFILDSIGKAAKIEWLGLGRPMLGVIVKPAEEQIRAFYFRRISLAENRLSKTQSDPKVVAEVREKLKDYDGDISRLSNEERVILRGAPESMPVWIDVKAFQDTFGIKPLDPSVTEVEANLKVFPTTLNYLSNRGETFLENRTYMKTQSATEAFMVYFKVSLLCSVVLASPWIFYQLWSFISVGLYPHEKKHINVYLPFSVVLFLTGVLVCQYLVLPGALKALIGFNEWVELDPDLRLNEWLGFALMLPLVFGISFQTPLLMFFMNRIGLFSSAVYWAKWRYAVFVLSAFSAIITPTPDAVTMMYLFVPMFGLYLLGAAICTVFPPPVREEGEEREAGLQVAV